MTPSSATPRRRRRLGNRNSRSVSVRGSGASARALAAGLWRLRHAQRMKTAGAQTQAPSPQEVTSKGRRRRASHLCHGDDKTDCQCTRNHHHHHNRSGILDKIEACVELPPMASAMEKATEWDINRLGVGLDGIFFASHHHHLHNLSTRSTASRSPLLLPMEAELEKARGHISELEDERRVMTKRLERFLRQLAEEKAAWKARVRDKARHAVAALKEELSAERTHRRQLEQANAKLMRNLAEARSSATQQAQSYEMERKARELMEEACSELTREVEEDQAEVELLRRECLRMREEMEEERRMLQMAEVWREERVQMKLSDAKLALETKYSQLNHLQAEMEAFLRSKDASCHSSALQEARIISDAAASSSLRSRRRDHGLSSQQSDGDEVDADSVLEHFRRKESNHDANVLASPASCNSNLLQSVSPATDLFLAKIDDAYAAGGSSADMEYDGGSWFGTSDRSASVANGNSGGGGEGQRAVGKNTALIRRLWRSAITESRKKTGTGGGHQANGGGWSPSSDRRSSVTAEAPPAAAEQRSWSGSVNLQMRKRDGRAAGAGHDGVPQQQGGKQSLREKLMEARMDDQKPVHAVKHKT